MTAVQSRVSGLVHWARQRIVAVVIGVVVLVALVTGGVIILGGSGSSGNASPTPAPTLLTIASPTTTRPEPSTTTSTTTLPPTTTSTTTLPPTTTTTLPPVTEPPTTIAETLPQTEPIAPPPEGASEPLVQIGRIEIPKIGLDRNLFEGITLKTLDQGPGHWPGTAQPGAIGNSVIAGHRVSHNKDFRNVDDLEAGDEIILTTDAGQYVYIVNRIEIVKPDALWIIDQSTTATATLFACHPPGSTRERIVVFADLKT